MTTRGKQSSTNSANEAWLIRNCPFAYTSEVVGRRWRPAPAYSDFLTRFQEANEAMGVYNEDTGP